MEIDKEELKKTVRMWFARLRWIEMEYLVHASALHILVGDDPDGLGRVLTVARKNPKIDEELHRKYDAFEGEAIESIERGSLDQALLGRLQDWKPEGPIN